MCGIIGALTFGAPSTPISVEKVKKESVIFIATQLLQTTVERGKDATGVSLLWGDGNYQGLKMGVSAPDFIARFGQTDKDFEGLIKLWREYPKVMRVFLGHCRKASVGNSYDNNNNHPIQVGDIVFVHNGTLTNHEIIFEKLGCHREGEVDSEAIGRLLHLYTNSGVEPFTTDGLIEVTKRLQGSYSVLAVSGNNPYQVAQFRDTRPSEMVLIKPLKTLFIASDDDFLKNILYEFNVLGKLFAPGLKLPYIKKADVEFKTLPDDSIAIWNLNAEITDKTTIDDLCETARIPVVAHRLWRTSTGTFQSAYNNRRQHQKTEVKANSKKAEKDDDEEGDKTNTSAGLVWSNSLNKYKTQKDVDKTEKFGSVEIDAEKGEVTVLENKVENSDADTAGADEKEIKEVSKEAIESLISNAADVEELAMGKMEAALDELEEEGSAAKKGEGTSAKKKVTKVADITPEKGSAKSASGKGSGKATKADSAKSIKITEVGMDQDPEALKAVEEYLERGLEKYESDDEVVDDLELADASVLKPLPIFALANRIKKFVTRQGFIAGYKVCKFKNYSNNKSQNAERKIAVLKMALKMMGKFIEANCAKVPGQPFAYKMREAVDEAVNSVITKDSINISKESLSKAFSEGELKNVVLLREIKTKLEMMMEEVKD